MCLEIGECVQLLKQLLFHQKSTNSVKNPQNSTKYHQIQPKITKMTEGKITNKLQLKNDEKVGIELH